MWARRCRPMQQHRTRHETKWQHCAEIGSEAGAPRSREYDRARPPSSVADFPLLFFFVIIFVVVVVLITVFAFFLLIVVIAVARRDGQPQIVAVGIGDEELARAIRRLRNRGDR